MHGLPPPDQTALLQSATVVLIGVVVALIVVRRVLHVVRPDLVATWKWESGSASPRKWPTPLRGWFFGRDLNGGRTSDGGGGFTGDRRQLMPVIGFGPGRLVAAPLLE